MVVLVLVRRLGFRGLLRAHYADYRLIGFYDLIFMLPHYYAHNLPIATAVRDLRSKDVKPLLGIVPPSGSC